MSPHAFLPENLQFAPFVDASRARIDYSLMIYNSLSEPADHSFYTTN
jgi:hypothetical protein